MRPKEFENILCVFLCVFGFVAYILLIGYHSPNNTTNHKPTKIAPSCWLVGILFNLEPFLETQLNAILKTQTVENQQSDTIPTTTTTHTTHEHTQTDTQQYIHTYFDSNIRSIQTTTTNRHNEKRKARKWFTLTGKEIICSHNTFITYAICCWSYLLQVYRRYLVSVYDLWMVLVQHRESIKSHTYIHKTYPPPGGLTCRLK